MAHGDALIAGLIQHYARVRGISQTYSSFLLTDSGSTLGRINGGCSLTSRRVAKIIRRAVDIWPANAEWPSDVPRPNPSKADGKVTA